MGGSQLKILLAVFALGLLGAAGVLVAYMWEKKYKPEIEAVQDLEADKQLEPTARPLPDPGKKQYAYAMEAIRNGELDEARKHLTFILKYYEDSSTFHEAKRVLGELNVDELLSPSEGPGKLEYTVKSGDALTLIARRNHTTIDYILRVNGRTSDIIRIGDKLWVTPLQFSLEANVSDKTLTVYRLMRPEGETEPNPATETGGEGDDEDAEDTSNLEEVFFKEYPIQDINIPPQVSVPLTTAISAKPAWNGSKRAEFSYASYHESNRWLQTSRPGVLIQESVADQDNAAEDRKLGFLMSGPDSRELYTYIRVGTELRVVK